MKQCPTCQSQYTDDTLRFCLQDGSPLQAVAETREKTLSYGEQETVVSNRPSNQINTPPLTNPTDWNPNLYTSNPGVQPVEKKSNATFAIFTTVFVMLVLFSFVGIGAWFLFRGAANDPNANILIAKKRDDEQTANRPTSTAPMKPTPVGTPVSSASSNTAANTAPVDKEQIKKDVSQKINSWKSAAESLNLNGYMSHYAGTVDYYNKKGASLATVRADKEKAFTTYDSIKIDISNMNVTPDASGDTATAVFDKEWVFEGEKYSAGKVQTQLKLKKIGGQWFITGERDLKVYNTK